MAREKEPAKSRLLSWGANSSGQLGVKTRVQEYLTPTMVDLIHLDPSKITSFAAGANHSLLLTADGSVYGAGTNDNGQLLDLPSVSLEFCLIATLATHKIRHLSTRWDTCYALDDNRVCLSWGPNNYGQQGHSKSKEHKNNDVHVVSAKVLQVAAGLRHVAILHEDGTVSTAGDNKKFQLGRESGHQNLEKVPALDGVIQIACGQNHSLALTNNGKIFGWGCNKFRQLANNQGQMFANPTLICETNSVDCKLLCGWTHSAFLNQVGKLTNWGRNCYSQLGIKMSQWESTPRELDFKPFKDVAFGAEHCLGITVDDELVSWGWNEHGNCGIPYVDVEVPTFLNIDNAITIGAGTGQSFCVVASYNQ